MRVVSLIPKNKDARQLTKRHGERWEVLRSQPYVTFDAERGPWLLVQPLAEERAPAADARAARVDSAMRWVHEFYDRKFKVAP